jgi:hypothetical protein
MLHNGYKIANVHHDRVRRLITHPLNANIGEVVKRYASGKELI